MYLWIGRNCHPNFLTQVLGVPNYAAVPDNLVRNIVFIYVSCFCSFSFFLLSWKDRGRLGLTTSYIWDLWDFKKKTTFLTVSPPWTGHCRVAENQSFCWMAQGSKAVLSFPACHQVSSRPQSIWQDWMRLVRLVHSRMRHSTLIIQHFPDTDMTCTALVSKEIRSKSKKTFPLNN